MEDMYSIKYFTGLEKKFMYSLGFKYLGSPAYFFHLPLFSK